MEHEHKFVHIDAIYSLRRHGTGYCYYWKRVDRFFCEKCLEPKEIVKEEMTYGDKPEWYKG